LEFSIEFGGDPPDVTIIASGVGDLAIAWLRGQ